MVTAPSGGNVAPAAGPALSLGMDVRVKRIYEQPSAQDGCRVLVDRLWPRGLKKDRARVDRWLRDLAPSGPLRKWFAHDPARWEEFVRRYHAELDGRADAVAELLQLCEHGPLTLLFAARDISRNNAVALEAYLKHIVARRSTR